VVPEKSPSVAVPEGTNKVEAKDAQLDKAIEILNK